MIEHNLDVIKTADWLIDLGPEGGSGGGLIVGTGTPEDIAKIHGSHTGRFLAPLLGMPEPVASTTKNAPAKKSASTKNSTTKKTVAKKAAAKPKK